MPAGHDDGSPAKKYADDYHKARAAVVARFREIVKADWPWEEYEPELLAKMDMYGLTIDNLIQ